MYKHIILALLGLVLVNCSKDKGSGNLPEALPSGSYEVTGPNCNSSASSPVYTSADSAAQLYDFNVDQYQLVIDGLTATQIFTDNDCKLSVAREISANSNDYFSFKAKMTATSEPAGCEISIVHDDTTFPYTTNNPVFVDDSSSVEVLFAVQKTSDTQFELKSLDQEPDKNAWQAFGCANPDQIIYSLLKL